LGSLTDDKEPPVEVPGVVPTVVVEEEDSSVEIIISGNEMKSDQAVGAGTEPVPEDAMLRKEGQAAGTGEPVLDVDKSGEKPELLEVDLIVRTGEVPVLKIMEERTGPEPVPEVVDVRTGAEPILEKAVGAVETVPIPATGEGDLRFEDFPGDEFEKVGEFTPEESSQRTPAPALKHPAKTPSGDEPRKKRIKTLAGRTDLPWVRKLKALKEKTSSSSPKSPPKQSSQPTRKSYRLAAQGVRSSSINQGPPVIEEIPSSSEGLPVPAPAPVAASLESPVLWSEQASTENSPHQTPTPKPVLKRKAEEQPSPATKSPAKPSEKRVKTTVAPSPKLEKF